MRQTENLLRHFYTRTEAVERENLGLIRKLERIQGETATELNHLLVDMRVNSPSILLILKSNTNTKSRMNENEIISCELACSGRIAIWRSLRSSFSEHWISFQTSKSSERGSCEEYCYDGRGLDLLEFLEFIIGELWHGFNIRDDETFNDFLKGKSRKNPRPSNRAEALLLADPVASSFYKGEWKAEYDIRWLDGNSKLVNWVYRGLAVLMRPIISHYTEHKMTVGPLLAAMATFLQTSDYDYLRRRGINIRDPDSIPKDVPEDLRKSVKARRIDAALDKLEAIAPGLCILLMQNLLQLSLRFPHDVLTADSPLLDAPSMDEESYRRLSGTLSLKVRDVSEDGGYQTLPSVVSVRNNGAWGSQSTDGRGFIQLQALTCISCNNTEKKFHESLFGSRTQQRSIHSLQNRRHRTQSGIPNQRVLGGL